MLANVKCVEGIVFSGAKLLIPRWHTTLTGQSLSVLKNGLTNSGLLEQIPRIGFLLIVDWNQLKEFG